MSTLLSCVWDVRRAQCQLWMPVPMVIGQDAHALPNIGCLIRPALTDIVLTVYGNQVR